MNELERERCCKEDSVENAAIRKRKTELSQLGMKGGGDGDGDAGSSDGSSSPAALFQGGSITDSSSGSELCSGEFQGEHIP